MIGKTGMSSKRRYSRLAAWLAIAFGLPGLGIVSLYGAAQYWMLDKDETVTLDLIGDEAVLTRTADLLRSDVHHVFHVCCDDSTSVILDVDGRPARRFVVRPTDGLVKGSLRSELRLRPNGLGQAVWYRASLYVPEDWKRSDVRVTAMQWHGTRDVFLMEPGRTPPLQLEIIGDQFEIVKSWDQRLRTPDENGNAASNHGRTIIASSPLVAGEWSQWTFRVKWSTGDDGSVLVWHNGDLIVEDRGPNAHRDLIGPYLKAGVYVPDWTLIGPEPDIDRRELYFSELIATGQTDPFGLQ